MRKKITIITWLIPVLAILFLSLSLSNTNFSEFLNKIINYNLTFPKETVYVHTDREVYAPGDKLWFKAYIRNKGLLNKEIKSKTLFITILNSKGDLLENKKFVIHNSNTHGQLSFDQKIGEGFYYIVAYTSWMKNYSEREVFKKKFQIKPDIKTDYQFSVFFNKTSYNLGDTIFPAIYFNQLTDNKIADVDYKYYFKMNDKIVKKGKGNIKDIGYRKIEFIVLDRSADTISFEVQGVYKGMLYSKSQSIPVNNNIAVQFFPEGGNYIDGLFTRMAFKASTNNNRSFDIQEGIIYDERGDEHAKVNTSHEGIGVFGILPDINNKCYLQITKPENYNQKFFLPKIEEKGWTLNTRYDNRKLIVDIKNNFIVNNLNVLLTVKVRETMFYFKKDTVNSNKTIEIPTYDIPPGIAVVTLYNNEMLPSAERLVYINHENELDLSIIPDRTAYLPRDQVKLNIKLNNIDSTISRGSYSLAVVDDELCNSNYINEPNIVASLYLSPEIKGIINNPGQYFDPNNKYAKYSLDLLLLTQGWRKYSYHTVIENNIDSLQPPKDYDIITGQVKKHLYRKTKPISANLAIIHDGGMAITETDSLGYFKIIPEYFENENPNFMIAAMRKDKKNKIYIKLDKDNFNHNLALYLLNNISSFFPENYSLIDKYSNMADPFSYNMENSVWIEEIIIAEKQRKKEEYVVEDGFFDRKEASDEDIAKAYDIYDIMVSMGLFVYEDFDSGVIISETMPYGPVFFVIDRIPFGTDYSLLSHITPDIIDRLLVIKGPETLLYGEEAKDALVVSIYTKKSIGIFSPDTIPNIVMPEKFTIAKEFYSPVYDTDEKRSIADIDLRKTIYWEPNIEFNEKGEAEVTFYNADRFTKVKCIVEGISDSGIPVYSSIEYEVSTSREQ